MRRCGRCALVAGVLALLLSLLLLPFMKAAVDGGLRDEATKALGSAGVTGVSVSSDWAALTLTGPQSARDASLAAAHGIADAAAVDTTTYVASDGSGSSTTGTVSSSASPTATDSVSPGPSASPTTAAAVPVSISAAVKAGAVTLTGTYATQAQKDAVVSAAKAAFATVDDQTTVAASGAADPADDAPLAQFATLLTAFGKDVSGGTLGLASHAISVSGNGKDAATTADVAAAVTAATGAGVSVSGTVDGPAAAAGASAADVQKQLDALLAIQGVTFATDSSTLTPAAVATLDKVVAVLKTASSVRVAIGGHTDNRGSAAHNQSLSAARAQTVKAYLAAHGIDAARMTTTGFGSTRPVAGNDTEAGRQANRRIAFTVQGS